MTQDGGPRWPGAEHTEMAMVPIFDYIGSNCARAVPVRTAYGAKTKGMSKFKDTRNL